MQFNTYMYALAFLPITVIGYFLINRFNYSIAKIFLVVASALFYIYAGIEGFKWLVISMVVNYILAWLLKRRKNKGVLWVGIILNIALLFYFKYTNFAITSFNEFCHKDITALSLVLPIGISFFTFQQIGYLVDTYGGGNRQHHFGLFALCDFLPQNPHGTYHKAIRIDSAIS